ncbi:MAG: SDR family oxidoreductase [Bdellovibrionales bacterium]
MTRLTQVSSELKAKPRHWLLTGAAGFIGSNLLEHLLSLDQHVVGMDNFATGFQHNLDDVKTKVSAEQWSRFKFYQADICNLESCMMAAEGADIVLHHAALGSVPRSINNPIATNQTNVSGFINVMVAAKDKNVRRIVFASSSSVYGDNPDLPKVEERVGRPLSPYAASKVADELYGMVFGQTYGLEVIGLRYFNVFGARQTPNGPYAAVIPKWVNAMLKGETLTVFGDGETSRDFCYVKNVLQMNLLAATTTRPEALNRIYNTAFNARTSLNQLLIYIEERLRQRVPNMPKVNCVYNPARPGDIHHSQAAIALAQSLLGYEPQFDICAGLNEAIEWYAAQAAKNNSGPFVSAKTDSILHS